YPIRRADGIRVCLAGEGPGVRLDYPLPHQARRQLDRQLRRLVAVVEDRVDLDNVQRTDFVGLAKQFHQQMRLAERQAAGHGCADAGRNVRIERIHIQADVDRVEVAQATERLPRDDGDALLVDVGHGEYRD